MGSIFRLAPRRIELHEALDELTRAGIPTLATSSTEGSDYTAADLSGAFALFLGNEGAGLPRSLRERMAGCLRIPLREGAESLSVASAAAVLLFEAARQRRLGS